MIEFDVN